MKRKTGEYERNIVAGEEVSAFIPYPLPPRDPPLELTAELATLLARAEEQVRLLDLAGDLVPSIEWFVYAFVRKEAVLSAQIEGTQATLVDVLAWEQAEQPGASNLDDIEEVTNYVAAVNRAFKEIHSPKGPPISVRLLNDCHRILMQGVRGATKQPGELRRSQNWIGGSRPGNAVFVPPPPEQVADLLSDLERYIHADDDLASLLRIAPVEV